GRTMTRSSWRVACALPSIRLRARPIEIVRAGGGGYEFAHRRSSGPDQTERNFSLTTFESVRAGRQETPAHGISFREATWVWAKVAALSFGGPAGQIAVMHRI